jgi:aryl-alcohol dehydrogenase-like predicted oxidoreductase
MATTLQNKFFMQQNIFAEFKLSQLMLGTVQFGLEYGIANKSGQPTYEQARDILAAAYEGGVNCLDTAAAYGASEEVVGRALAELGLREEFIVVSKVPGVPPEMAPGRVDEFIEANVHRSLQRSQLGVLPVCLFHQERDARYLESLHKAKEKGLVQHVGVSGLTPQGALKAVTSNHCEALQIPTSILDRTFLDAGVFSYAQSRRVAVFVRSVFLQGLLMMRDEEIPPQLSAVLPVLVRLRALAHQAGITLQELALRYTLGLPGVTCVLTGVESVAQMRENIRLFSAGPLPPDLMQDIGNVAPALPDNITRPYLWTNRTG